MVTGLLPVDRYHFFSLLHKIGKLIPKFASPVSTSLLLLRLLYVCNKLIERFAPSIIEAHILMLLAVLSISMNHDRSVFRPLSVRFKRNHGCK